MDFDWCFHKAQKKDNPTVHTAAFHTNNQSSCTDNDKHKGRNCKAKKKRYTGEQQLDASVRLAGFPRAGMDSSERRRQTLNKSV